MKLARRLYQGRKDARGLPYIDYLRAVAAEARESGGPSAWVVAMLHTAVTDELTTFRDIRHWVTEDELIAIGLLTRKPDVPYPDHVRTIRDAPGAPGDLARVVTRTGLAYDLEHLPEDFLAEHPEIPDLFRRALVELGEGSETVKS